MDVIAPAWSVGPGTWRGTTLTVPGGPVRSVFEATVRGRPLLGLMQAVGTDDIAVWWWDPATGSLDRGPRVPVGDVVSLARGPVSLSVSGSDVRVFDLAAGECLGSVPTAAHPDYAGDAGAVEYARSMGFTMNRAPTRIRSAGAVMVADRILVVTLLGQSIAAWDLTTGGMVWSQHEECSALGTVTDPDGRWWVLSGQRTYGEHVSAWDAATGEPLGEIGSTFRHRTLRPVRFGDRTLLPVSDQEFLDLTTDRTEWMGSDGIVPSAATDDDGRPSTVDPPVCAVPVHGRPVLLRADPAWTVRSATGADEPLTEVPRDGWYDDDVLDDGRRASLWVYTPDEKAFRLMDLPARTVSMCAVPRVGGGLVAVVGADGVVRLCEIAADDGGFSDRHGTWCSPVGHVGPVERLLALTVAGRPALLSAGDDATVRLWDAVDGRLIRVLAGPPTTLEVLYTEESAGRTVLVGESVGAHYGVAEGTDARVWDLDTGAVLAGADPPGAGEGTRFVEPPDDDPAPVVVGGRTLIARADDAGVEIHDPTDGRTVCRLHPPGTGAVVVDAGGGRVIVATDEALQAFDIPTGQRG